MNLTNFFIPAKDSPLPKWRLVILLGLLVVSFLVWKISTLIPAPTDFPVDTIIEITPGMSVAQIANTLHQNNFVRSEFFLYLVLLTNYNPSQLKASTYIFDKQLNVFELAQRITEGDFTSNLIRFTHIEGERAELIAARAAALLEDFNFDTFVAEAKQHEGKLFPETYYIPIDFNANDLLTILLEAYEDNISPLRPLIAQQSLTEEEVIVLASIIEREANSPESMRLVSGILHNRLEAKMALQVDATMEYILDKPLKELTAADLEIDTPYNTYLYRGLPPTAIGNPGLEAIMAVLEPTPSDYFFYLTDEDGNFYYAKNFDEHRQNIARYLR